MTGYAIKIGDAREWLAKLKPASIDALVCDPPAGISFMGKTWDHDHGHRDNWIKAFAEVFALALRTLKPGAHGLVWALPRTSHWTATALEDAGFEIRDIVMHLFGTGFPKSLDVSKAIDEALCQQPGRHYQTAASLPKGDKARAGDHVCARTPAGATHNGEGTALKPAAEHWILVRRPRDGTVAENVLAHGTGGLNIDACRIGTSENLNGGAYSGGKRAPITGDTRDATAAGMYGEDGRLDPAAFRQPTGRWPAHVTLDEEAAAMLDAQSGMLTSGAPGRGPGGQHGILSPIGAEGPIPGYDRVGGASRFFYVTKASRAEREAGLDDLPAKTGGEATGRVDGTDGLNSPRAGAGRTGGARNHHPTVKAIALMRWLIRLITPPGGVVLDPFMGSGSTGIAALAEGFRFVGIERDQEYVEIARRRIEHAISEGTT